MSNRKNEKRNCVGAEYGVVSGKQKQNKKVEDEYEKECKRIKATAAEIIQGRKRISCLVEEAERGRCAGGKRNVEASIVVGESQKTSGGMLPLAQERLLKKYDWHVVNKTKDGNTKRVTEKEHGVGKKTQSTIRKSAKIRRMVQAASDDGGAGVRASTEEVRKGQERQLIAAAKKEGLRLLWNNLWLREN